MGPDDALEIDRGQVFFAPVGTELPASADDMEGWMPLGYHLGIDFDPWQAHVAESIEGAAAVLRDVGRAAHGLSLKFEAIDLSPRMLLLLGMKPHRPKRWRKKWVAQERQRAKAHRDYLRMWQRYSIGIGISFREPLDIGLF